MMDVARSVNVAMAQRNLDTEDVGKLLGLSQQRVCQLRRNENASSQTLRIVAVAFGLKVSEFIALGED